MNTPDPQEEKQLPDDPALERDMLELKLKAEFGMLEHMHSEEMPPELARMFLQQVYDFEKNFANAGGAKSFRETLNLPQFEPWPNTGLDWNTGEEWVRRLLQVYEEKNIVVIFENEYSPQVKYTFLAHHLPVQTNYFGKQPQFHTTLVYEEYFPNHGAEIERKAISFLNHFFNRKAEGFQQVIWRDQVAPGVGLYDGQHLIDYLNEWFSTLSGFEKHDYRILQVSYEITHSDDINERNDKHPENDDFSGEPERGMGFVEGIVAYIAGSLVQAEPLKMMGPFKLYFEWRQGDWAIIYPSFPGLPTPPPNSLEDNRAENAH
ncbi:MAG: hypothetical protein MUE99_06955 [Chitinophagaceae bacterium]|nr:hypothetical protein [Chitinophagaceae bacterium]